MDAFREACKIWSLAIFLFFLVKTQKPIFIFHDFWCQNSRLKISIKSKFSHNNSHIKRLLWI